MWHLIIELFHLVVLRKSAKEVSLEQIDYNMRLLKKRAWFQAFLINEKYRHLLIYDQDIRVFIGKVKEKKLLRPSYEKRQHDKLERLFIKKLTLS